MTTTAKLNSPTITRPPAPPLKFLADPELKPYFQTLNVYFNEMETWRAQVYRLLDKGNFDPSGEIPAFSLTTVEGLIDSLNEFDAFKSSVESRIDELDHGLNIVTDVIDSVEPQPHVQQASEQYVVSTAVDYTASDGEELIIATDAITIELDSAPFDLQKVSVKRVTSSAPVVVDGNGNTIDGNATFSLYANYDSFTFMYSNDAGEWLVI